MFGSVDGTSDRFRAGKFFFYSTHWPRLSKLVKPTQTTGWLVSYFPIKIVNLLFIIKRGENDINSGRKEMDNSATGCQYLTGFPSIKVVERKRRNAFTQTHTHTTWKVKRITQRLPAHEDYLTGKNSLQQTKESVRPSIGTNEKNRPPKLDQ